MVQSKIDKTINYPETKELNEEDKDYDADLFEISLFDDDIIIAVGQGKFTFIDKNVVYYPVYIIKNERVDSQIGVYEILSDRQVAVLDEDGDLDVEKLGQLLLYSFATSSFIKGDSVNTDPEIEDISSPKNEQGEGEEELDDEEEDDEEQDEEEEEDDEEKDGEEDEEDDLNYGFSPLQKQNAAQAKKERDAFVKQAGQDWVAKFMRNNNYKLVDNEGGGDCLFAVIRDGLKRVGIQTSVAELRDKLANEATQDIFEGYRNMYLMAKGELNDADQILKDLAKQHRDIKKRTKKTGITRDEVKALITQANNIGKTHNRMKKEKKQAVNLLNEYSFMRGVDNLEQLKAKIRTCTFWGETWAISTLERVLNVKLVLFSLESFRHKDLDNVLLCGQLNDTILEERGRFEPSHYILTEFMGYHYRLVTYKDRGAFTFEELPFDVKQLIVDKCMEKQAGPYYIIPEFRSFMSEINITPPSPEDMEDIDNGDELLYDDDTVFQFYSRSANVAPGKGAGEKIKAGEQSKYAELASIPNWRHRLSNFFIESFELDGHTWSSVEHYYQASKFKENNEEFYLTFALDMNPEGELAINPALAKGAGGKTGKFKGKRVRPADVKIDPNFFSGRHKQEMKRAQHAKFTQNEDLTVLLLATHDAKLQHFVRASPPVVFTELMEIRSEIERKKNKK